MLIRILFAVAMLCVGSLASAAPAARNVVFIIADDLGARDTTPFNPDCFYDTPNLQRLADSGMRFTNG